MTMKIKAVIFDLDGVVADSEPISAEADDIVLAKYGIKKTPEEKMRSFGRTFEDIFGDILLARKRNIGLQHLKEEKNRVLRKLLKGRLKPVENSLELVGFLLKKGFKLALATSSQREKMAMELEELGIEHLFRIKVSGDDVEKGKPDPEIFLKAAELLNVRPGECAVIEDSGFGVRAAKSAGMFSIGFRSPNSPGQDLSAADTIFDDLGSVKAYFGKD